jgi:uncharacterized protein with von Willebrand factor type A (vWA) domain
MFIPFFYELRARGVPVSPTAFLRLEKALHLGMVNSLMDFYVVARSVLVKSERWFDLYDRVFAHYFEGAEFTDEVSRELEDAMRSLLEEWLKSPEELAELLGMSPEEALRLSPDELVKYFLDKLQEQTEAHHGGNRWIGTRGTSPVGHSGQNPASMRVGGSAGGRTAIKIALERRYKDYSLGRTIGAAEIGEALRHLKDLQPVGPRDAVNIEKSIKETCKNCGEIEIVLDKALRNRLRVILMMDNGGWSMDPYLEMCQTLFAYASWAFKELSTYYFHNCIYDQVWEDPQRLRKPVKTADFARRDPATRLIIVGDASMAPYELVGPDGSIYYYERQSRSGLRWLQFLAECFPHRVWLNPKREERWEYTEGAETIARIREVFPMFDLTLEGLERAVQKLKERH